MSTSTVDQAINNIVDQLKDTTDEQRIKVIVTTGWSQLKAEIPNENTFNRKVRTPLRKAIEEAFPSSTVKKSGYYQTKAGKNKETRWEHLALWYATTNEDRWSVTGDKARAEYWSNLPSLSEKSSHEQQVEQPIEQTQATEVEQTETTKLTVQDMTLEQLELDSETQQIVNNVLARDGMSLADFIKKACTVYAKTLEGKAKQSDDDLSMVSTEELLNVSQVVDGKQVRSKYFTHPRRAEELTRRAITAIKRHNVNASEKAYRWHVNQTAIQTLTGSRPATVGKLLEQYKTEIDDHNQKYELKPYDNRKGSDRKIENEVDLIALVPDGLE